MNELIVRSLVTLHCILAPFSGRRHIHPLADCLTMPSPCSSSSSLWVPTLTPPAPRSWQRCSALTRPWSCRSSCSSSRPLTEHCSYSASRARPARTSKKAGRRNAPKSALEGILSCIAPLF